MSTKTDENRQEKYPRKCLVDQGSFGKKIGKLKPV